VVDLNDTRVSSFVFFENELDILAFVRECFDVLSGHFGEEVCGVVAYSFGRGLGERIYRLAAKRGFRDLRSASDFLASAVKRLRLAKDAVVFVVRSPDDRVTELLVRIASSSRGRRDAIFYVLRGVISQFYRLLSSRAVEVSSLNRSDDLRSCYEYVVKISRDVEVVFDE